jgi:hypothetical protein
MVRLAQDVRIVPLLIALAVAVLVLQVLSHGNYCLVPTEFLQPGDVGRAETSIYGFALYRKAGIDHEGMYHQAVWWYEMALWGEWLIAVALGATVYLVLRVRWRRRRQA